MRGWSVVRWTGVLGLAAIVVQLVGVVFGLAGGIPPAIEKREQDPRLPSILGLDGRRVDSFLATEGRCHSRISIGTQRRGPG